MSTSCNIKRISSSITKEECESIIENKFKNSNSKVLRHQLMQMSGKNGFLGDHRRLLITIINENGKEEQVHCFAKFLPENEAQIEFVLICGVFKKEVFIYKKLFPKIVSFGIDYLKNCVPECYLAEINRILVFDDVTDRNFLPLSKFKYFDYHHVIVSLKTLAKLQASSLIFEEKMSEKLKKPYRLLDDYANYFYETFYVDDPNHKGGQGFQAAIKGLFTGLTLFPEENFNFSNENFKLKITKTCLDIFKLVQPSKKYRNAICHGDLWATNIMIKYQDGQPIDSLLLDFQTVRYCPPAHDFMSFIYLTTSREFRKQNLTNLQQIYYNELEHLLQNHGCNLKTIIPYEEFQQTCELQKVFAVVQNATYVQLTQAKDKWIEDYSKNVDLWNDALYVDRSRMVVENCREDPEYKFVFKEGLKDLLDICSNL